MNPVVKRKVLNLLEQNHSGWPDEVFYTIRRANSYEISNYGRVRHIVYKTFVTPYFLEKRKELRADVQNNKGNVIALILAHEVLKSCGSNLARFIRCKNHQVDFIDGNPINCQIKNLKIIRTDGIPFVETYKKRKWYHLTPDQVRLIRYDHFKGMRKCDIARKYKVGYNAVFNAIKCTWHKDIH